MENVNKTRKIINNLNNKNKMKNIKNIKEKLELLHLCLMKDGIPVELPKVLERYQYGFVKFKEIVQNCESSNDDIYINALSEFRDLLLQEEDEGFGEENFKIGNIEQLFVLRHGEYNGNGNLSNSGKNEIIDLIIPQIKELIRYDRSPLPTIALLSSNAPRALESAILIRNQVDTMNNPFVGVTISPYLWSAGDAPNFSSTYYKQRDCNRIVEILENSQNLTTVYPDGERELNGFLSSFNVVIIMSHLEVVNEFPQWFIRKYVSGDIDISSLGDFEKGEGIYIDILKKNFKKILKK